MHTGWQGWRHEAVPQRVAVSPRLTPEVSIIRRIIANPEILGGKPIVEGTRLSVDHILTLLVNPW